MNLAQQMHVHAMGFARAAAAASVYLDQPPPSYLDQAPPDYNLPPNPYAPPYAFPSHHQYPQDPSQYPPYPPMYFPPPPTPGAQVPSPNTHKRPHNRPTASPSPPPQLSPPLPKPNNKRKKLGPNSNPNKINKPLASKTSPHPKPYDPRDKTAVMALHEYCTKQQWSPPTFKEIVPKTPSPPPAPSSSSAISSATSLKSATSSFTIKVVINNVQMGTGVADSKSAARQLAARRALLSLLPGIAFNESNGICLGLSSSLYRDNELSKSSSEEEEDADAKPPMGLPKVPPTVVLDGTTQCLSPSSHTFLSGISDDETVNSIESKDSSMASSVGSSVFSTLLYAMWQIDPRIREPPSYSYRCSSAQQFVCSAKLFLYKGDSGDSKEMLEGAGEGGTKKNSRHSASAELLRKLFPDCGTLVEVIAAADAQRERHAQARQREHEQREVLIEEQKSKKTGEIDIAKLSLNKEQSAQLSKRRKQEENSDT